VEEQAHNSTPEPVTYPTWRNHGLRMGESWFEEPVALPGVDIVHLKQRFAPPQEGLLFERATLLTNLREAEEALWNALSKENRYEVRRARARDGVEIEIYHHPTEAQLQEFVHYYSAFAQSKGLSRFDKGTQRLLGLYRQAGRLVFGVIDRDEQRLVQHVYYVGPGDTCRLLYSASLFREREDSAFRALVGRANRLLHWEEMCWFREQEYRRFDWGGWHAGADPAMLRINDFKESFGGTVTPVYFGIVGVTVAGRLMLRIKQIMRRRTTY